MGLEKIKQHRFIVFGGEHYNPLGMIRSLGEEGIFPVAIILKGKVKVASKSKYISHLHLVESYEEGYKILIKQYADNKENKTFLLTGDDALQSFLDARYDNLKEYFFMYNAGAQNRIIYFMDKENICNLALKKGLSVLPSKVVNKGEIPDDLEYPIITKAINSMRSTWKEDVFICYNESQLREAYRHIVSSRILLQRYIVKKNELCLEGCSVNKGRDVFVSMASQYNYILSDTYSPYMTIKNYSDESVLSKCKAIIEEIGFEGIFSIEFLIGQDNELYFLEVNMRNSTWSYASTKLGMNLPVIWASGMLNQKILVDEVYKEIPLGYTAMVEFADFSNRVKNGNTPLGTWLKDYKKACHFLNNKKDIMPTISYLQPRIADKVKRILRLGENR